MSKPLIEAPPSDTLKEIETLGYLDGYDAVLNNDYAFVVFRETDRGDGGSRLRVASRITTGAVFEPDAMRERARAAHAQGLPFFTWGAGIEASAGDPRCLEYRVHVSDGKPSALEIHLQLRKADGSADAAKSLRIDWPL